MTSSDTKLKVIYRKVSDLRPYDNNSRIHSERQIDQIAKSIKRYGWTSPLIIDEMNTVLAGHGRLAAATKLQLGNAPTIQLKGLSDAEKRAYVIADNKIAENAVWDKDLLASEFRIIAKLDVDFELTTTGFAAPAIDGLLSRSANDNSGDDLGHANTDPNRSIVSQPGDLWRLGSHKLYCGDATDA